MMTKKNIFNNHTDKEVAIINRDNEDACKVSSDIKSNKNYFSRKDTSCRAYFKDEYIYLDDKKILDTKEIAVPGEHNIENVMAALIACSYFKMDIEKIKRVFEKFWGC